MQNIKLSHSKPDYKIEGNKVICTIRFYFKKEIIRENKRYKEKISKIFDDTISSKNISYQIKINKDSYLPELLIMIFTWHLSVNIVYI